MRHNRHMKDNHKLIPTLILAGLLGFNATLFAADKSAEPQPEPWYQIEVLVYEPVEQIIAGEAWPAIVPDELPESIIELKPIAQAAPASGNTEAKAFQELPPEDLNLAELAGKLVRGGRYRIITIKGWQQLVKQRHEADTVHLSDKQIAISNEPEVSTTGEIILNPPQQNPISPVLDDNGLFQEEVPARINGTVTVSVARYLHMALDLRYYNPDVYLAEQIALQKPDEVLIEKFMMKQSRRMRSKEVHVFDHPYFGVIATITPVETNTRNTSTAPL